MWLIDAEELILKHSYMLTECEHGAFPMVVDVDDICNAPAVEAEPVKHAHWEIKKTGQRFARCSACGRYIRVQTTGNKETERFYMCPDEMHYCPHCGAKMGSVIESVEGGKHE